MLNAIALVAMIASGVVLPLMDVIFGKFVNVFNDFIVGKTTAEYYRSEINVYAYAYLQP